MSDHQHRSGARSPSRHAGLTAQELAFVADPPSRALARVATVTPEGSPHVVPVGWSYDVARGVFVLGGRGVLATARARHVRANGRAAVTIDGVGTEAGQGWSPSALLVRGRAELDDHAGAIVLHPDEVVSWGLPTAP